MQARWILPRHRQFLKNCLNRSGAISVYRTVCWMFLGPEPTPPPGGDNRKELPHAAAKATETASPEATEAAHRLPPPHSRHPPTLHVFQADRSSLRCDCLRCT